MSNLLLQGDCLEQLKIIPSESIDAIITDPPYGISFMAKKWDYDVPSVEIWKECLRVLKPGAHLLSFAGTRTQHRMAINIEDAGFEIRDMIAWIYGSGFPKSLNIGKSISEYEGYGTALKPALEPITLARKPISEKSIVNNVLKHGTGGVNIDGCRVGTDIRVNQAAGNKPGGNSLNMSSAGMPENVEPTEPVGRFPANLIHDGSDEVEQIFPKTKSGGKNIKRSSGADNNGNTGSALGSESRQAGEEMISYGDQGSASRFFYCAKTSKTDRHEGLDHHETVSSSDRVNRADGSAGKDNPRAGAGRTTAGKNHHPTVKPTKLMRYLCRLITPPNGTIIDPFMGSGSTGKAAVLEGFNFIGIERDPEYFKIAESRIKHAQESIK